MSGIRRAQFRKIAPIDVSQESNLTNITNILNRIDIGLPVAADLTYWASQSANKAIKTVVDASLALKADASYVSTELAKKIGIAELNNTLANKQDQAALDVATNAKLEQSVWNSRIADEGKWFVAFKDAIVLESEVEGVEFDYASRGLLETGLLPVPDAPIFVDTAIAKVMVESFPEYRISTSWNLAAGYFNSTARNTALNTYGDTRIVLSTDEKIASGVFHNDVFVNNISQYLRFSDMPTIVNIKHLLSDNPNFAISNAFKLYVHLGQNQYAPITESFTLPA